MTDETLAKVLRDRSAVLVRRLPFNDGARAIAAAVRARLQGA
jgi:hypothetical protein